MERVQSRNVIFSCDNLVQLLHLLKHQIICSTVILQHRVLRASMSVHVAFRANLVVLRGLAAGLLMTAKLPHEVKRSFAPYDDDAAE